MIPIKKFVIDGKNFHNDDGFYDEFEKAFLKGYPLEFVFGRNLDAFDDILYPDEQEKRDKLIIIWKNFDKSKKELPPKFLRDIIGIIKKYKRYINFKTEK